MSEGRTTRQQKAEQTRAEVFAAAVDLFAKHGYHQTTVAQIAGRAGVAKGTFFVHFESKDAVLAAVVAIQTRAAQRARERVLESGGTPVDAIVAVMRQLSEDFQQNRELARAVLAATLAGPTAGDKSAKRYQALAELMRSDAKAAQAAGLLASDPEAEAMVSTLLAIYLGGVLVYSTGMQAEPFGPLMERLIQMNLNAWRADR